MLDKLMLNKLKFFLVSGYTTIQASKAQNIVARKKLQYYQQELPDKMNELTEKFHNQNITYEEYDKKIIKLKNNLKTLCENTKEKFKLLDNKEENKENAETLDPTKFMKDNKTKAQYVKEIWNMNVFEKDLYDRKILEEFKNNRELSKRELKEIEDFFNKEKIKKEKAEKIRIQYKKNQTNK